MSSTTKTDTAQQQKQEQGQTATNSKVELGLLEEDDEFEEFETEDWNETGKEAENEEEVNLWEDNWDDDNIEDDFTIQLRFKNFLSSLNIKLI
jgi:26 proteasome complex subunit DSS1